jgi:hypothetical protein
MKKSSTLFLKVVILLITVIALAAMIRFPQTEGRAANLDLISIYADPFIVYLYIASLPFFTALYQAFRLLELINQNNIFSPAAVKVVQNIKYSAMALLGLLTVAVSYVFVLSKTTTEDGAGAIVVGLVLIFTSSVIATAAAVFQKLLQNAVDMKSENDLTI